MFTVILDPDVLEAAFSNDACLRAVNGFAQQKGQIEFALDDPPEEGGR